MSGIIIIRFNGRRRLFALASPVFFCEAPCFLLFLPVLVASLPRPLLPHPSPRLGNQPIPKTKCSTTWPTSVRRKLGLPSSPGGGGEDARQIGKERKHNPETLHEKGIFVNHRQEADGEGAATEVAGAVAAVVVGGVTQTRSEERSCGPAPQPSWPNGGAARFRPRLLLADSFPPRIRRADGRGGQDGKQRKAQPGARAGRGGLRLRWSRRTRTLGERALRRAPPHAHAAVGRYENVVRPPPALPSIFLFICTLMTV